MKKLKPGEKGYMEYLMRRQKFYVRMTYIGLALMILGLIGMIVFTILI